MVKKKNKKTKKIKETKKNQVKENINRKTNFNLIGYLQKNIILKYSKSFKGIFKENLEKIFLSISSKNIIDFWSVLRTSISENIKLIIIIMSFYVVYLYFTLNYSLYLVFISNENLFIAVSILAIVFSFLFFRKVVFYFTSIYKTKRIDIILTYIFILYVINNNFNLSEILYFQYIFFFILANLIRIFFLKNNKKGILVKDKVLENDDKDELGFDEKVKDFSEILYNNGSLDNQIFGLVAEWGAGKSSFLNLLSQIDKIKNNCLYIEFNPWYYENEKELLEKFLENISSNLKKQGYYLPKLSKAFYKFVNLLDSNSSNLFGLNISFSSNQTLSDLKENINESLKTIDKKIIIVIDDLDRISSQKFKEIFKIVDLCRDFHNTNYILCYDPLNFNSIDSNLIETISQNDGNIVNIDTENIDNKELIKYMSKIINVYYSLSIDKLKLKEYFINLFISKGYLDFSDDSKEGIRKGINELFSLDSYRLWGKYYSNIRGIKRILNNLISLDSSTSKEKNYMYNLFDINGGGLDFDIFVKFGLLKLYYNSLYRDIEDEFMINGLNSNYYFGNKYSLSYRATKENENYESFLKKLNINERNLITDIIPVFNNNIISYSNKIKLREGNNIKSYIDIEQTNIEAGYNRFILGKVSDFKNDINLKYIFDEIYNSYEINGLRKFISEFKEQIWNWEEKDDFKQNKAIELIDFLINYDIFYKFDIKDKFTFYIDIASVLNNSSPYDNSNSDNLKYIGEYFYGEGIYKKSIYNKILDKGEDLGTDEGKIISLRETLRLLFSLDERRGGNFFNFWNGVGDINKLYNLIFSEFKKRYIDNTNIFQLVFDWEELIEKKGNSMISHITYMLTHYANNEAKIELCKYFIKCFTEDLNLFLKFLESYVKDSDRLLRGKNKDFYIDINGFYENFIKEDIIKFSNDNKEKLKEISNKDLQISSVYQGGENIELNQKELLDEFYIRVI